MTLLNPPVEKPHKSRAMAITLVSVFIVLVAVLYFTFRYYPEKKADGTFFRRASCGRDREGIRAVEGFWELQDE